MFLVRTDQAEPSKRVPTVVPTVETGFTATCPSVTLIYETLEVFLFRALHPGNRKQTHLCNIQVPLANVVRPG